MGCPRLRRGGASPAGEAGRGGQRFFQEFPCGEATSVTRPASDNRIPRLLKNWIIPIAHCVN